MAGPLTLLKALGRAWKDVAERHPQAFRLGAPAEREDQLRWATDDVPIKVIPQLTKHGTPRPRGERLWKIHSPANVKRRDAGRPMKRVGPNEYEPMTDLEWLGYQKQAPLATQLRTSPYARVTEIPGQRSWLDDSDEALDDVDPDLLYDTATIDSMNSGARGRTDVNPRLYYTSWDMLDNLGLPDRGVTGLTESNSGRKPSLLMSYGLRDPKRAHNVELNPNMFGMDEHYEGPYYHANIDDPQWYMTTQKDPLRDVIMDARRWVDQFREGEQSLPTTRWLRAGKEMTADERTGLLAAAEAMKVRNMFKGQWDQGRWPVDNPRWAESLGLSGQDLGDLAQYGIGKTGAERGLLSDWLLRRLHGGQGIDVNDGALGAFVKDKLYARGGRVRPGALAQCSCGS